MSPLKLFSLCISLAATPGFVPCDGQPHWSYKDDEEWKNVFPVCGTKTQSPIDFMPETIVWNQTIPAFGFHNYEATVNLTAFDLTNNGHSVQMNIKDQTTNTSVGTHFWISGGGLPSNYTIAQFHFHWGERNDRGSEHTVEEAAYPMELHLVHWDAVRRRSVSEAMNTTEGLAVLGIFVQIGETNNTVFDSLIKYFQNITYKGNVALNVPQFPLIQLLPNNTRDFYRYRGSLTTPPCFNSVVWTVFKQPITISELQLEEFRTRLFEGGPNDSEKERVVNNYRRTQEINDRTVYKTFEKEWSYEGDDGADNWKLLYPRCSGNHQSPIDIAASSAVQNDALPQFVFINYPSTPPGTTFKLVNKGTSVDLLVVGTKAIKISGGGLTGDYVLEKVTFHWGNHNGHGSDHRFNGLAYPLEMQFLHYSSKYANSQQARRDSGGLAILSVLFQASPEDNSYLDPVWSKLGSITRPGNSSDIGSLTLTSWIPRRSMSFYRYSGSLTIPSCAESVTWTVFTDPLPISANQLKALRSTIYSNQVGPTLLANNFRAPQSLNGRLVTRSIPRTKSSNEAPPIKMSAMAFLLSSALFAAAIQTL